MKRDVSFLEFNYLLHFYHLKIFRLTVGRPHQRLTSNPSSRHHSKILTSLSTPLNVQDFLCNLAITIIHNMAKNHFYSAVIGTLLQNLCTKLQRHSRHRGSKLQLHSRLCAGVSYDFLIWRLTVKVVIVVIIMYRKYEARINWKVALQTTGAWDSL